MAAPSCTAAVKAVKADDVVSSDQDLVEFYALPVLAGFDWIDHTHLMPSLTYLSHLFPTAMCHCPTRWQLDCLPEL
jgi:hypothetical protein